VLVLLSPKFQFQLVGIPVEVSVNRTVSGAGPLVGEAVKLAMGGVAVTEISIVCVELPYAFDAVS